MTADEINKRVLSKVKNGSIVLLHNGAKNTPEALKTLLPALKEKGFEFATIAELIYRDNFCVDNYGKQIKN